MNPQPAQRPEGTHLPLGGHGSSPERWGPDPRSQALSREIQGRRPQLPRCLGKQLATPSRRPHSYLPSLPGLPQVQHPQGLLFLFLQLIQFLISLVQSNRILGVKRKM